MNIPDGKAGVSSTVSSPGSSWSVASAGSSFVDEGNAFSVSGQEQQLYQLTLSERKVGLYSPSGDADVSGEESDSQSDECPQDSADCENERKRELRKSPGLPNFERTDSLSSGSTIRPETPSLFPIISTLREWKTRGCQIEALSVGMSSTPENETEKHDIPDPVPGESQVWLVKPPDDRRTDSVFSAPDPEDMPENTPMVVKVEVIALGRKNRAVASESTILRNLEHDHIVAYISSGEQRIVGYPNDSGNKTNVQQSYLQMEYVGDNLLAWLGKQALSPEALVNRLTDFSCQCFEALTYLQESEIVHCDIKPENLLVDDNPTGKPVLKIADFGFAYDAANGFKICRDGKGAAISGSEQFAAPETKPKPGVDQTQTYQSDIYSLGLTIASILCDYQVIDSGYRRVGDRCDLKLTLNDPTLPGARELVSLIEKTLKWHPDQRVTAGQAAEEARKLLPVDAQLLSTGTEPEPLTAFVYA
ncbi:protein kinase family protein [Endozoicomonas sp. SCSIO W0465]|uniref:protein kinase family protein n=1 Tax=Endozoicomonas sp. SCSIO W0465 TaxID=2918516 RepID=UPI0020760F87|nr:protein kinase family protein [Endozoicomonas sp. SCSIO W0465]USE37185.1 protein kinase family protein [Endozoicomonas sp. SCSIO W0465]